LNTFNGLINLTNLELGSNEISNIHESSFDGLPELKLLNLGSNKISNLMLMLKNLEILQIEHNPNLTSFNCDNLVNLKELHYSFEMKDIFKQYINKFNLICINDDQ